MPNLRYRRNETKLYSEYVNCLIGEVSYKTEDKKKSTLLFCQVLTASLYYATCSLPQRID